MIKKVRHGILSKSRIFISLKLPLLKKASESWPNLLMILSPLVTPYGNPSEKDAIAQEVLTINEAKWARQDSNLRPSLCKSDVLTMLDYWP